VGWEGGHSIDLDVLVKRKYLDKPGFEPQTVHIEGSNPPIITIINPET
jgi:hypothetical protein